MKLVKSQAYALVKMSKDIVMKHLEVAGRVCYRSEGNITEESADRFIKSIISRGHESVIEHIQVSAIIICERSISHQIVRHRLASHSQESQRYCNYSKERFDGQIRYIIPTWLENEEAELKEYLEYGSSPYISIPGQIWIESMLKSERDYKELIRYGWTPEQARTVIPNSAKTELMMTMNLREWRHFLNVRGESGADPQIVKLANILLEDLYSYLPAVFEDIVHGK